MKKGLAESQIKKKIKTWRFDNGKEFKSPKLEQLLKKNGIVRQLTVPFTPEQNGVAERVNRNITEKVGCIYA